MIYRWVISGLVLCCLVLELHGMLQPSWAGDADTPWVSRVVSIQGHVVAKRHGEVDWRPVGLNDTLFVGDQIRVEANSRAGIVLSNDAVIRLDQNTTMVVTEIEPQSGIILNLLKGAAHFFSTWPRRLTIVTPFVNGVVEGTEFFVRVDDAQTQIDLFEGRIRTVNEFGELQLAKGQGAVASSNMAPQSRILVHPRESVQWTLYYPPILAAGPDSGMDALRQANVLYNQGQATEALDAMETVAESDRDYSFYTYRAALLLNVGRVDQAQKDIQHALSLHEANSEALALEAVIAVVQNRKSDAARAAEQAVQLDPRSAAAQIALSYTRQAAFNLQAAIEAAQAAVAHEPENGTAWARLAELRLSTGELDKGIQAAQKAAALNPQIAHAHAILGFAYLTQIKTKKAQAAFTQAIDLDSAAPLPRLGLGLAKIRDGNLEEGRAEIEIAAGLDPGNALIRSYLGKAYFDEKRGPLDQRQFDIAKALDPNDPTPWFYDAIRKQTLNRPVEAFLDLQKSIELNDNRAVYRSRLLLDQDLAARSASLGRVYNDLDFQHLSLLEGYKSLDVDSTNYSAHRLLADTFAVKPRHEIARVSELLQAQLFQPLNLTPVQARLADTDKSVFVGAGPADLSFNEFNPLFTRNRVALQASGLAGNNQTWGDEITGSGVYNRISGSLGQFHYQTDGFRENNDDTNDIYNVFLQGSLTHRTSLQGEYRYAKNKSGDHSQNFDNLFSEDQRNKQDITTARIGAHHSFSPQFDIVASYIHSDTNFEREDLFSGFPTIFVEEVDGDIFEFRTDFKKSRFGLIGGFNYMDGTLYRDLRLLPAPGIEVPILDNQSADFFKNNIYAYSTLDVIDNAVLTIGLSAAAMEVGSQIEEDQLNPKFGLSLKPFAHTTLRLAAFRVLSSTYVSSQTAEPTQVSGFNQFFDDLDASDVKSYGVAIDQAFSKRFFGGIEYLRRDLDVPQFIIASTVKAEYFEWKEHTGLAYLYWTPSDTMALRAEYQYDQFDREENPIGSGIVDIETHRVPLSVRYFHPLGFSFGFVATYFSQKGEFIGTDTDEIYSDSDYFWTLDAETSYRLPKRWGILSVGVKNLLDENFHYKDTDPSNPAAVPGVFVFGKITLSF
jgi:Flp pilus assembly protein TadD